MKIKWIIGATLLLLSTQSLTQDLICPQFFHHEKFGTLTFLEVIVFATPISGAMCVYDGPGVQKIIGERDSRNPIWFPGLSTKYEHTYGEWKHCFPPHGYFLCRTALSTNCQFKQVTNSSSMLSITLNNDCLK